MAMEGQRVDPENCTAPTGTTDDEEPRILVSEFRKFHSTRLDFASSLMDTHQWYNDRLVLNSKYELWYIKHHFPHC